MSHRTILSAPLRLRRSLLAVPASSEKMIAKAHASEADAVFLDLEDAVSASEKAAARKLAVRSFKEIDWRRKGKSVSLRVNGLDTDWTYTDIIEVVGEAGGFIDTVIVPKVGLVSDLYAVDVLVSQVSRAGGFEPPRLEGLVETALGVSNLESIASYNDYVGMYRLEALHFGAGDYAASVGARTTDIGGLVADYPGDQFHYVVSRLVSASRAYGVIPMDSAYGDFGDLEGFEAAAKRAVSIGMGGKWCIHPSQIEVANRVFSPTADEVKRAKAMIKALEAGASEGKGAIRFEGKMIDGATERMARSLLATHEAISKR